MPHRGDVFKAIDRRLREYRICIENHVAEESTEGELDAGPGFQNRRVTVGRKVQGTIVEGSTTLVGITFRPKNFQDLWAAFRDATRAGAPVFHYHELSGRDKVTQTYMNLIHADPLHISYLATKAGMPGKKETAAWGFREIRDLAPTLDDRPLLAPPVSPDRRFGARFAPPPERKVDITSLHVALTPDACNIHIDQVGFTVRGPDGVAAMSPDFLQHLLNELVFQTNLRGALGEWVTDHFSIILPSSDNGYAPMVGVGLSLPRKNLYISAAFTFNCRCLPSQRFTIDETMVPIPEGWSVGVGLTLKHDWFGSKGKGVK